MRTLRVRILALVVLFFGLGLAINAVPMAHANAVHPHPFVLSAKLANPNPNPIVGEHFGVSVAISSDGGSILIGAPLATISGLENAGEAFLFDSFGNLLQTFTDPSPVAGEAFGIAVAISGDASSVLVGAPDKPNFPHPGAVFLFSASGNLVQTFTSPSQQHESFGSSVAISTDGSNILIGAPGFLDFAGEAFLFDSLGNLLRTFEDPTAGPESFGTSVSMSADARSVLVGAPFGMVSGTHVGTAFLFSPCAGKQFILCKGTFHLQTFHDPNPQDGEQFGASVSIAPHDNDAIVIGAPFSGSPGCCLEDGAAFLFDSSGNLLQAFQGNTEGGRFGTSVSVSGNGGSILIGDLGHNGSGFASLFDSFGNLRQTFQDADATHSNFGASVAISSVGRSIVVGEPAFDPTGLGVIEGRAFLFEQACPQQFCL
jgi:hypothetical protein